MLYILLTSKPLGNAPAQNWARRTSLGRLKHFGTITQIKQVVYKYGDINLM